VRGPRALLGNIGSYVDLTFGVEHGEQDSVSMGPEGTHRRRDANAAPEVRSLQTGGRQGQAFEPEGPPHGARRLDVWAGQPR